MNNKVAFGVIGFGVMCTITGLSLGYVAGIVYPPKIGASQVISAPPGLVSPYLPYREGAVFPRGIVNTPPNQIPSQAGLQPSIQSSYAPSPAPVQGGPLSNPDVGRKVMQEIAKLRGVMIGANGKKIDETQVVTIFFDPRCPFCHSLFRAIGDKIPVKWVPIPVLSDVDQGIKSSAFILSAKNAKDGRAAIETAFSYIGEGSVAHTQEDTQKWLASIQATDQQKKELQENVAAFVALHKAPGSSARFGVPSVLVPMAGGAISVHEGYEPGDENKIIADYKRGR